MNASVGVLRDRRLAAMGLTPLHLRVRPVVEVAVVEPPAVAPVVVAPVAAAVPTVEPTGASTAIRRLALQPDVAELQDPALNKMFMALTEAVPKAGLQPVRVCDVAADPTAAVMVFGAASLPEGVPAVRVLRVDPLRVLQGDRERKRRLWEQLQALGRSG